MRQKKDKKVLFNLPKSWRFTGLLGSQRKDFLNNLTIMLSAGMDILTSLKSIRSETKHGRMGKILDEIIEQVEGGEAFSKVLRDSELLPTRLISLIKIGEESGRLAENLEIIVRQQEKESLFTSKLRTAMLYPAVVLPITFIVGLFTAWFTLPHLTEVFKDSDIELPFLTQVLLAIGDFFRSYGNIFVPILVSSLIILFYLLFGYKKTKFIGQAILINLPVIRYLVTQVELARFGYVAGSLFASGVPVAEALDSLVDSTSFEGYKKLYGHLKLGVEEGKTFKQSFADFPHVHRLMPSYVINMISTAEMSGNLADTFLRIGHAFELKVDTSVKDVSTLLEPALLLFVGLAVGLVALGVMMPIYNLAGAF